VGVGSFDSQHNRLDSSNARLMREHKGVELTKKSLPLLARSTHWQQQRETKPEISPSTLSFEMSSAGPRVRV
jgi:hypothetical protein